MATDTGTAPPAGLGNLPPPPPGGIRDQAGTAAALVTAVAAPGIAARDMAHDKALEKMGAGGTSARGVGAARAVPGLEGPTVSGAKGLAKTGTGLAALPVVGAVLQLAIVAAFLKFIKGLLLAIAAMVMNFVNMVITAVMMGLQVAVPGLFAAGGFVAGLTGGLISAGTGVIVVGTSVVMFIGGVIGVVNDDEDTATLQRDGALVDCQDEATTKMASLPVIGPGDTQARTEANARTVYSVFSSFGMVDENIAGILGNWDIESGVDPTSVEGIFDEPHQLGAKKLAAQAANFTGFGSVEHRGIGLGQWTDERNQNLLGYADGAGQPWSSLPIQLGFMLSDAEGANAAVVTDMIDNPLGSPGAAAVFFHDEWERSADTSMAARQGAAEEWMGKMGGWTADDELAESILAQSGSTVVTANNNRVSQISAECLGAQWLQAGWAGDVPGIDDPMRRSIVTYALEQVGLPYAWSGGDYDGPNEGSGPGAGIVGFDCSGLTASSYNMGAGIRTNRQAQKDYNAIISQGNLQMSMELMQPGDMVFFNTTNRTYANHVAIYLGDRMIVHAPFGGSNVRVEKVDPGSYYDRTFIGGGFYGNPPVSP